MVFIGAREGAFIHNRLPDWTADKLQCPNSQTRAEANGTMGKLLFRLQNNDSFAKAKVSASLILALAKPYLAELRALVSLW